MKPLSLSGAQTAKARTGISQDRKRNKGRGAMGENAIVKDAFKRLIDSAKPTDYSSQIIAQTARSKAQTQAAQFERFSADETVNAILEELRAIEQGDSENRFVVLMRTPDNRMMQIDTLRPLGFSAFVAEGWIDDLTC